MSREYHDPPTQDAAQLEITSTLRVIAEAFISPNETDANGEYANVIDGLFAIARAIGRVADALEKLKGAPPP